MIIVPTNTEVLFDKDELIVSRTDTRGIITYCNQIFINISGYTEAELLGKPHSLIRHPEMPKAVFKLLWDYINSGKEIFAYVKNLCKGGEFYWVIAHITPTYNTQNKIIGYHSNRRLPTRDAVKKIPSIYDEMLKIEKGSATSKEGTEASLNYLLNIVNADGSDYNEYILKI